MIPIDGEQRRTLKDGIKRIRDHLTTVRAQIENVTGGLGLPLPSVVQIENQLGVLEEALRPGEKIGAPVDLDLALAGLVRAVASFGRRQVADDLDSKRDAVIDAGVLTAIDQRLAPFNVILAQAAIRRAEPPRIPRSSDFLRPNLVGLGQMPNLGVATEPKFHILLSPEHLLANLTECRRHCDARRAPTAVAFLDIDDFKAFNSAHGEPRVDRDLLPTFFRALDAGVFGHGSAYRYGGDECVLILPSSPKPVVIAILQRIQTDLRQLEYPNIDKRPSVSIGVCVLDADSSLTNREALGRAAWAKKQAKNNGKNCIAIAIEPELGEQFELVRALIDGAA